MIQISFRTVLRVYISIKRLIFDLASQNYYIKNVKIRGNVLLGNDCKILKTFKIGENSLIAINSVVKNDIIKNCIAKENLTAVVKYIYV